MYTLHDEFMPAELQAELLADIGSIVRRVNSRRPLIPSQESALAWMDEVITNLTGEQMIDASIDAWSYATDSTGKATNSDIHNDDPPGHGVRTKFVTVVSNTPRMGTLFFEDTSLYGRRTETLFERQAGSLALMPDVTPGLQWAQVAVGQLCSFTLGNQLHAAAPFFAGDSKIIFTAFSKRSPRQNPQE